VLWNRVIDVAQLSIAMSVLTIFIPLTIALVLKMTTFLSLKSLIDRALFKGSLASCHLLLLLLLTWHTWHLLAGHLLVLLLLGEGHLLLRLLLLGVADKLLAGISANRHGHKRRLRSP